MYSDYNDMYHISLHERPSLQELNVLSGRLDAGDDTHNWSRWRMAVNDRLYDDTLIKDRDEESAFRRSRTFVDIPYRSRLASSQRSGHHRDLGPNNPLDSSQFLYYGIPRVESMQSLKTGFRPEDKNRSRPVKTSLRVVGRRNTYCARNDRPSYEILLCTRL